MLIFFITSWRISYPIKNFPSLWKKLAQHQADIILIQPIYDEIEPYSQEDKKLSKLKKQAKYPLRTWLSTNKFSETSIDDEINQLSLDMEYAYQVKEESKGVGKNDLLLIAYAKIMDKTVVTFEAIQNQEPDKIYNSKIPLVCQEKQVKCINFVEMVDSLGIKV